MLLDDVPKEFYEAQDLKFTILLVARLFTYAALIAGFVWIATSIESNVAIITGTLLLAVFTGVFLTQIAEFAHDIGHQSAIRRRKSNRYLGIFLGAFVLGVSPSWWKAKHNVDHHENPNRLGFDTDIEFPVLAFDPRQLAERRKIFLPIIMVQHWLIVPLMTLQAINTNKVTIEYLLRECPKDRILQAFAVILHWASVAVLIYFTGWIGLLFVTVALASHGLCNGSVFAPNHKPEEILDANAPRDRLWDQVATTRNAHGNNLVTNYLVDFWTGGLNYQIEHHLFPTMPRGNLKKVQPIVQKHCKMNGIPYHSTTLWRSYMDTRIVLKSVAHALRKGDYPRPSLLDAA